MFLQSAYKQLQLVAVSKKLVYECYSIAHQIPADGLYLSQKIKTEMLDAHLNISKGAFHSSKKKRDKFFKSGQLALISIDAALDAATGLGYVKESQLAELSTLLISCYKMLKKILKKNR